MKKILLIVFSLTFALNYINAQVGSTCTLADVVSAVPYFATGLTTNGTTYGSLPCSGTGFQNYMSGNDYVFSFIPTSTGNYNIALANTGYAVGLFVTDLCPDDPSVQCVAYNVSPTGNPTLNTVLNSGTPYYIVVSSNSITTTTTNFDISIQSCTTAPTSSFTYSDTLLNVTFTNTSTDAVSYLWYFGDEAIILPPPFGGDTSVSPIHTYASYGTYNVTLITYNACGATDTLVLPITLVCPGTYPVANFSYLANGLTVDFTNNSTDVTTFAWFFGDSDIFPFMPGDTVTQNPSHTYLIDGTYTANLIVYNECGSDTFALQITVVGTSILNNQANNFSVNCFPNPTSKYLTINIDNLNNETAVISLINSFGKEIISFKSNKENSIFNLENFSKGVYTFRVQTNTRQSNKIIIIK